MDPRERSSSCVSVHFCVCAGVHGCMRVCLWMRLPVCVLSYMFVYSVLKRGKVKKSKNDLIHAEEGEDHFTDISSVGKDPSFD